MNKATKWYVAGLILLSAVFVQIILQRLPLQLDFSAQRNYTLSKGSKAILKKIEEPLILEYYFTSSNEQVPKALKDYGHRIEVFLKQYEHYSHGMIQLRVIDPKPDTKEEENAIRAGIRSTPLPNGDSFFMGLVAIQADHEETIDLFATDREALIEYDVSKLITQVQRMDSSRIGIISGLPIEGTQMPQISGMPPQGGGEPEWVFLSQLKEQFDITMIDAAADAIDPNLDLLLVLHPINLKPAMQYAIDQYLLSGKPVVMAVDPSSVQLKQSMGQQQMMMGANGMTASDLPDLFKKWGIDYNSREVIGDLKYAARVSSGMGQAVPYPVWMNTDHINPDVPAVSALQQMLLIESGSFSLAEGSKLELTPLIETSASAAPMAAMTLMYTAPEKILSGIQDEVTAGKAKQYTLAGIITGDFQTAFPDGKPVDEKATEDDDKAAPSEPAPATEDTSLKDGKGTLVFIADTDFLDDRFSVERINFLGNQMLRPLNDNLNFILNITEYLTGSKDLIALRGRGTASRPFKKVQELEMKAQMQYQEELDTINDQLTQVQTELKRIQGEQNSEGTLVASPELQKAIADYKEQEANAVARRREIRKHLREDIESLDRNLAMFNLLFIPLLLSIFGIRYFIRRSRSKR